MNRSKWNLLMNHVQPCVILDRIFLVCTLEHLAIRRIRQQFCVRLDTRLRCLCVPSFRPSPYNRANIVLFSLFVQSDRNHCIPNRRHMPMEKCLDGLYVNWHPRTTGRPLLFAHISDHRFRYRFHHGAVDWICVSHDALPRAFPVDCTEHRRMVAEMVNVLLSATWPIAEINFSDRLANVLCYVHCQHRPNCANDPNLGSNLRLVCIRTCVPTVFAGTSHYWLTVADGAFVEFLLHLCPVHRLTMFEYYTLWWKLHQPMWGRRKTNN